MGFHCILAGSSSMQEVHTFDSTIGGFCFPTENSVYTKLNSSSAVEFSELVYRPDREQVFQGCSPTKEASLDQGDRAL